MMRRHDEEFTVIFNATYAGLCRFLEGMTGRQSVAQELAQECFLRLYRAGEIPAEEAKFWLYRVARNLALNKLKKRSVRFRFIEKAFDALRPSQLNPEEQSEKKERAAILRRLIADLPEGQRAALLLREREEMSYGEIARVLGISESKVKVDIFRARAALRLKWSEAIQKASPLRDERFESNC